MLAYLDTLIGFAVVMLVISLLITILTQMVSGLLNHRGSNLLWGLKTLFANIDPKRFPKLTENAERVAHGVLTHCMISDSWFSGNKIAQWIGSHFPLVDQLFTRFQLATAIRPGELRDILQHFASNTLAENEKELAAEIQKLLGITQVAAVAAAALGQQGGGQCHHRSGANGPEYRRDGGNRNPQTGGLVQLHHGSRVREIRDVYADLDSGVRRHLCLRDRPEFNCAHE